MEQYKNPKPVPPAGPLAESRNSDPVKPVIPLVSHLMPATPSDALLAFAQQHSAASAEPRGKDLVEGALAPTKHPIPNDLQNQIAVIDQWAEDNRTKARREQLLFWALKAPVIGAAGYGLMIKLGWDWALVVTGALASACALVEGFFSPGALRNFHHKAYFDLTNLAGDLEAKWQIGMLNGEAKPDTLTASLLEEARTRMKKISAYLADAEATLGKEQPKKKK